MNFTRWEGEFVNINRQVRDWERGGIDIYTCILIVQVS